MEEINDQAHEIGGGRSNDEYNDETDQQQNNNNNAGYEKALSIIGNNI